MYMITEYITAVVKIVADFMQGLHEEIEKGKTPDYINIKKQLILRHERQMLLKKIIFWQIFNTLYEITTIYLLKCDLQLQKILLEKTTQKLKWPRMCAWKGR